MKLYGTLHGNKDYLSTFYYCQNYAIFIRNTKTGYINDFSSLFLVKVHKLLVYCMLFTHKKSREMRLAMGVQFRYGSGDIRVGIQVRLLL